MSDTQAVRLKLALGEGALAARLRAALEGVAGIALVEQGAEAVIGPVPAAAEAPLTSRELEVLALLAEGASNKGIARRLGISVHTAKFHVGQVLDKLDATGRTDAVAHAARLGVIML